ncbi:uncharacterized protein LOC103310101 [Acyrthosiphon pisum]|uniref:Transposable element Tc3 transposase n=1 Tax=Acyrthosiphon pisum TaxID=7029 RepID=A0A8R2B7W4_ACYPI|nr:uncharacterized protein LOC103310101 [Acyrthosiphon pisum]|eukprot:XP_008185485.1 PREDICTED: uncharacterized protein LOC103310101 [Acyrthosiphon pisum]
MNNAEKVDLLLIYGECQRLNQEGRFPGTQINQQRHRGNIFDDDKELQVLAYIRAYPRSSMRHVPRESGVSYGDSIRRLEFIAWFNTKLYDNPLIDNQFFWSDESKFTNNGIMNKQNHRYWDDTNPHWSRETNFQTIWGINVWCGLVGGKLIGPFFFDGTLIGRRYLNFLTNELPRLLDDVSLDTRERMFFQQDGAPAHNAIIVRQHLNKIFPNRWIGTNGAVPWPARSPDLTPLDFFYGDI